MTKDSSDPGVCRWLDDARSGDGEARTQLLRWSRAELRRMASRHLPQRLRGVLGASDLVQEAMVKVHRGLGATKATGERQYRGWLRVLLTRVGIDAQRSHAAAPGPTQQVSLQEQHLAHGGPSPSHEAADREERAQLHQTMARLPALQRQALELYLNNAPIAEIAQRTGRTEQAAASLVKRGLKALRGGP